MKYLAELQKKKVFNLEFVTNLTGNIFTAKSLLQSYKKHGYVSNIKRDLYVALDLVSNSPVANRYEIGSVLCESACISHHSALEYYGLANQVFYTIYVTANERIKKLNFDGFSFEPCRRIIDGGVVAGDGNDLIRVTDLERTIVDCLYDFEHSGGLEEFLECLQLVHSLDESKLLKYLEAYDQIFLWQKAGFIMEQYKNSLHIGEAFLNVCQNNVLFRKRKLTDDSELVFYPRWKLYARKDFRNLLLDGDDELV